MPTYVSTGGYRYAVEYRGISDEVLARKVRNIKASTRKFQGSMEEVNRRSVVWLASQAQVNLEKAVEAHGRPGERTYELYNAIGNVNRNASHSWNEEGFEFAIHARMSKQARYWRVIEYGTAALGIPWIGRHIPVSFRDPATGRLVPANERRSPRDEAIRSPVLTSRPALARRGRLPGQLAAAGKDPNAPTYGRWTTIQHHIKPYHYIANSWKQFGRRGIYIRYLGTALKQYKATMGPRSVVYNR